MKLNKKKGFTIVELVIVIAVIAILAAVAIPTFSSVIKKAYQSNALQMAKAELDNQLAEKAATGKVPQAGTITVTYKGTVYTFQYTGGKLTTEPSTAAETSTATDNATVSWGE